MLRYYEALSDAEIAEVRGCAPGTRALHVGPCRTRAVAPSIDVGLRLRGP